MISIRSYFIHCVAIAFSIVTSGSLKADDLRIAGVANDAAVKGLITITAEAANSQSMATVEYLLNGKALSGPIATPPYKFSWYSASIWDGPNSLIAIARDATGKQILRSDPVTFNVANGSATIKITAPDLTKPLSGTVKWTVEAQRPLPPEEIEDDKKAHRDVKPFEALIFAVDGVIQTVRYGSGTGSFDLDTTQFPNGPHELFASAYAFKQGIPPVAMTQTRVTFDNGHAVMGVRPTWRDIFLAPGTQLHNIAHVIYCDNSVSPAEKVMYSSDHPEIATVDYNEQVNAIAPGVATITTQWHGYKATTRVIVDKPHGFPHFSCDGQVLTEYDPARSLFVRSMFFLNGDEAARLPGEDEQIHAAGVNALTTGFYFNPGDQGHPKDFDTWRKGWEPWFDRSINFAKEHNYALLLTGDDICRTTNELNDSVTNPWAAQSIGYAFTKARDSKRVVGIEMIDEASGAWGGTPKPTNNAWVNRQPPIPDDAFTKLIGYINGVPNRPLITWPVLGIAGPDVAHNWMGDPTISDYASHYWDILDWRRVYPGGASIPQLIKAMNSAVINRYPVLQRDRPFFLLTSVTGPFYHKRGPGTEYVPGQDEFIQGGPRAVDVSVMNMYAAAMGMAGVRAYGYDGALWKNDRKNGGIGAECQTGADPFETGTDRWWALSASYNLLGRLEPYLFQPSACAEELGSQFVTGARKGSRGSLFIAVNGSEMPSTTTVNLAPYRMDGTHLTRFRLCGSTGSTARLAAVSTDTVTFAPGETIVWLFAKGVTPPSVRFASPLPELTATGAVPVNIEAVGNIEKVELYADEKLIATKTAAPFTFSWDATAAKSEVWHCLRAVGLDANGSSAEARTMVKIMTP